MPIFINKNNIYFLQNDNNKGFYYIYLHAQTIFYISFKIILSKRFLVFKTQPRKHLLVFKTSWRRLQVMSWRSLQQIFSVTVLRLVRRLQDVFKTSHKTSWRRKIFALKTSWSRLEDMSWRRFEDMSCCCLEDISWRRLQDVSEANKMFTGDICT